MTFAGASLAVVLAILASLDPHEGRAFTPYWDVLGKVWTVCRGVTGDGVVPGKTYTSAECDALEQRFAAQMLQRMGNCVTGEFELYEIKAWGHFAWNVGTGNFCASTAAKLLNSGQHKAACAEISRWYLAGGRDCRVRANKCFGIVERRQWERAVCEGRL